MRDSDRRFVQQKAARRKTQHHSVMNAITIASGVVESSN